jgi:hypothetical protein
MKRLELYFCELLGRLYSSRDQFSVSNPTLPEIPWLELIVSQTNSCVPRTELPVKQLEQVSKQNDAGYLLEDGEVLLFLLSLTSRKCHRVDLDKVSSTIKNRTGWKSASKEDNSSFFKTLENQRPFFGYCFDSYFDYMTQSWLLLPQVSCYI